MFYKVSDLSTRITNSDVPIRYIIFDIKKTHIDKTSLKLLQIFETKRVKFSLQYITEFIY